MAKRFTDTEKFNDPWYRKLSLLHKAIWEYLLAECNHAGILEKLDIELMSFKIGTPITLDDLKFFGKRLIFISDEVLYIPKFIKFQYDNKLNPQNKVHASVLKELNKWGINDPSKPLDSPLLGAKNKNKDKDKKKDKKKVKDIICNLDFEKCFKVYSENCTNLIPLSFERRAKNILNLLNSFLSEIDYDFEYFKGLCIKANDLKTIANNKIDFKSLLNNHIGIMNDKYLQNATIKGVSQSFIDDFFDKKRKESLQSG